MKMKEDEKIRGGNPFRVPEDYFGQLDSRLSTIPSSQDTKRNVMPLFRLRPFLLAAASAALIFVAGYAIVKTLTNNSKSGAGEETISAVYDSVYMNDLDIATLEDNLISNIPAEQTVALSGNEIIDFLISDDISILEITEQL